MRVLMFGWEFPPYISGGLGTACFGLTRAMSRRNVNTLFVLPRDADPALVSHLQVVGHAGLSRTGESVHLRAIPARISNPYQRVERSGSSGSSRKEEERRAASRAQSMLTHDYGGDLLAEVRAYAWKSTSWLQHEEFDLIHAHDWMTFPAARALAEATGKPFVAHLHSTEFDRCGDHADGRICELESGGLHAAQVIICVSRKTRSEIIRRYGVSSEKIRVIYNGIDSPSYDQPTIRDGDRIVLFLGRMTMQKGPDYFVAAAQRVLERVTNVKFVMAGDGDMLHRVVDQVARLGLGRKILFTGFLRGDEVDRAFAMADLYVMPSVSEPFGIAPLEAISHHVPVLISKDAGVGEVVQHALKVDFWDIDEMANKIIAVLRHPPLAQTMRQHALAELRGLSWDRAADACVQIYNELLNFRGVDYG
jgi:glycogen(starch) synthase